MLQSASDRKESRRSAQDREKPMPKRKISTKPPEAHFGRIVFILDHARANVLRAVNSHLDLSHD